MTATPKKKSLVRKSPIKGLSNKQFSDVRETLPSNKVTQSFFEDIVNVNKKNESTKPMDNKAFCKYLKAHVSKKELEEICHILKVPYNKDSTVEEICKTLEKKAPYVMTPRYVSLLKVLVTYSAYILGIFAILLLAFKYGKGEKITKTSKTRLFPFISFFGITGKEKQTVTTDVTPLADLSWTQTWSNLKDYCSHLGRQSEKKTSFKHHLELYYDGFNRYDVKERITETLNYEPILNTLAQIGMVGGVTSAVFDILGSIGLPLRGLGSLVGNFNSKVRNQVLKVLGKDTQKKTQSLRKKTIKKK